MEFNWRFIGELGAAVILCIIAMALIGHAYAEGGSYVIVTEEGNVTVTDNTVTPTTTIKVPPRYISQGDTVYIGNEYDISGVVPPYPYLAYWDGYDMYDSAPSYNLSLPDRKAGYYNFSIDPNIFATRPGKWYKYGGVFERQGNNLAFIVKPKPSSNYTLTFPNGTTLYLSSIPEITELSTTPKLAPELMPPVHVADYLVASDDHLNISTKSLSAGWIFDGHDNTILYNINTTDNEIVFSETEIGGLEPGDYKILVQTIGNTTKTFDVIFADGKIKWFDRSAFKVREIPAYNLVPSEAIKQLQAIFPFTYDTYEIKTLTVQDPTITIGYMNQVSIGSAKEYYDDPDMRGNVSLMDVRGYTNALPGTNVSVTLDEAHNNPREISKLYTYRGKAQGTFEGNMRTYQVYVPLYWDSLAPGMHNLTARTEIGGYSVANFPVSQESPNSYVPPQTIRFLGDSNPWKPNLTVPTPIVVVQTQVIEKVIEKPVPPSNETILEQQRIAYWDGVSRIAFVIGIGALAILGILGLIWAYRTHKRTMKEREWYKRQT